MYNTKHNNTILTVLIILIMIISSNYTVGTIQPVNGISDVTQIKDLITDKGILISDFDTINDWSVSTGGTQELDTSNFVEGIGSLKLTSTSSYVESTKNINMDLSSLTEVSIWVYLSDYYRMNDIRIYLSSSTNLSKYFSISIWRTDMSPGWTHLTIDRNAFTNTNGESWSNTFTKLKIRLSTGGNIVYARFDDLTYNLQAKAKCIITFDDGFESTYLLAKREMDKNNQPGVAFVVPSRINYSSYLKLNQLQEMYNSGWDISDHTWSHQNLDHLSAVNLDIELNKGYNWLMDNGFTRSAKFIAYPFGYGFNNETVLNVLKQNHIIARTVKSGRYQALPSSYVSESHYTLRGLSIYNDTPIATIKAWINQTISQNGLLILSMHKVLDSGTSSNIKAISDYLASKSDFIDVITFSDLVNSFPIQTTTVSSETIVSSYSETSTIISITETSTLNTITSTEELSSTITSSIPITTTQVVSTIMSTSTTSIPVTTSQVISTTTSISTTSIPINKTVYRVILQDSVGGTYKKSSNLYVSGTYTPKLGTTINFGAIPNTGYTFKHWVVITKYDNTSIADKITILSKNPQNFMSSSTNRYFIITPLYIKK